MVSRILSLSTLGARAAPHARAGARQTAQPIARSRVAHERSNATLPTNSVRAQRRTLAPGARQTAQPNSVLLSVRAQRRTLAPGARQTAQPIARN